MNSIKSSISTFSFTAYTFGVLGKIELINQIRQHTEIFLVGYILEFKSLVLTLRVII